MGMLFHYQQSFNRTNITKQCPGAQCLFAFYGGESLYHRYIFILQLCNLLVFLWLVNFTIALGQCTIAGAFASYYWARRKPADIPPCPVFSSFSRAIRYSSSVSYWKRCSKHELEEDTFSSSVFCRYHTGSLAFGSLILAVVQLIRVILEYLDHKLKGCFMSLCLFLFWSRKEQNILKRKLRVSYDFIDR